MKSKAQHVSVKERRLDRKAIAAHYFGADAPWFLRNIPFLEIDDAEIQEVYYYRWQLYRSHIRQIGAQGTTVLEFLNNVPWARQPYTDLNDSASFHLMEGRWLRDPSVVDSLIDHLYAGGANDRHFSESIAAATEATTFVTGEPGPALRHLDAMQHVYNLWDDHFDRTRNLYWIEPLADATEYTIASIDASGAGFTDTPSKDQNRNGFTGGYAFRPSINSYQYANARAISRIAAAAGKTDVARDYARRSEDLQAAVVQQLWNSKLEHFTDRYQRSTEYVSTAEFIRGRELIGYVPWMYELPSKTPAFADKYDVAWKHALSSTELGGAYGLRTVEPSYVRYRAQYRYDQASGFPECQWNGPSWPFQTSQALTAMANLLDDYPRAGVDRDDYLHLLRQYTHQHYLSPGHPDLQEDYDPDTGKPIVGLPRSHHYAHSTYVDLVISGLIGVRPRSDNLLEINPLVSAAPKNGDPAIRYFAIEGLRYHGHEVSVVYDADGSRYHEGAGLSVFVNGRRVAQRKVLARVEVPLGNEVAKRVLEKWSRVDLAVSMGGAHDPVGTASSVGPMGSVAEAIDGRMWFFPEIANGWSPAGSEADASSWYAIDFRERRAIGSVELYFYSDGERYLAPSEARIQYRAGAEWKDVTLQRSFPEQPLANGETRIIFPSFTTRELRVVLKNSSGPALPRLIEVEVYAPSGEEAHRP